jgi:acyl-CoA dehydrogenase
VQEQWLPRISSLDAIAALALTEPETGSDLRSISSRMSEEGGMLVVDGTKAFITNAGAAAVCTVLVREGDDYSLVVVPADTPGVEVAGGPTIIAPHILGEIRLTDVSVPADHRVGERGQGFALALGTLAVFRVSVAGAAIGVATAALREAVRHARTREQFGKPLLAIGAVSQSLASCWVEIEAARALTYRAAEAAALDPKGALRLSSMAKVKATETAGDVVDRCVQVMGRFGLVRGSAIERLYRNARPMRIYEGATEVILDSLARNLAKGID